jgi:hypothetical protein
MLVTAKRDLKLEISSSQHELYIEVQLSPQDKVPDLDPEASMVKYRT